MKSAFLALTAVLLTGPTGCDSGEGPAPAAAPPGRVLASGAAPRVVISRTGPPPFQGQRIAETRDLSVSFYGPPRFRMADAFGEDAPTKVIGITSDGFEMRYNSTAGRLLCSVRAKKASWGTAGQAGEMSSVVRLSKGVLVAAGDSELRAERVQLAYLTASVRVEGQWVLKGPGGTEQGTGLTIPCALIPEPAS